MPRRVRRSRRSPARSTSADAPGARPRSSSRPVAATSSEPAISTACDSRRAVPGGRPARGRRRRRPGPAAPGPPYTVRHEPVSDSSPPPAGSGASRSGPRTRGAGASRPAASTALSASSSLSFVANAAPPTATPDRSRGSTRRRTQSRLRGTTSAPGRCRSEPPRRRRRSRHSNAAIVHTPRLTSPASGGPQGAIAGTNDDSGSVTTSVPPLRTHVLECVGLVLVELIGEQERHVVPPAGEPHRELDVGAQALEQGDQRTGARGAVRPRIEGRPSSGRPRGTPRRGGRLRRPRHDRPARQPHETADRQHLGVEVGEPSRLGAPVYAPPYHAASKSSVAAARRHGPREGSRRCPGRTPLRSDRAARGWRRVAQGRPPARGDGSACPPATGPRLPGGPPRLATPGGAGQLHHDVGLVRRPPGGERDPAVAHQEVDDAADRGGQDHQARMVPPPPLTRLPNALASWSDPAHEPIRERFGGRS